MSLVQPHEPFKGREYSNWWQKKKSERFEVLEGFDKYWLWRWKKPQARTDSWPPNNQQESGDFSPTTVGTRFCQQPEWSWILSPNSPDKNPNQPTLSFQPRQRIQPIMQAAKLVFFLLSSNRTLIQLPPLPLFRTERQDISKVSPGFSYQGSTSSHS